MPFGESFDLNKIRVFVTVVAQGSFTRAARELGLPTSSVSRAIAQLETALGVQLFVRTPRSMKLTSDGSAYHAEVSPALRLIEHASARAGRSAGVLEGLVRVLAPPDLAVGVLADLVADFRRTRPAVRFDFRAITGRVDLRRERFDLALHCSEKIDPRLNATRVEPLCPRLYAAADYLALRGQPRSPRALVDHDCIVHRPRRSGGTWQLRPSSGPSLRVDVRAVIGGDDYGFLHRAVMSGAGIGPLPPCLTTQGIEAGRLVRILPSYVLETGAVWLVTSEPEASLPARVRDFKAHVLDHFARHGEQVRPQPI